MSLVKILYKTGQVVVCKPGFVQKDRENHKQGGGSGYEPGKKFTIRKITIGKNTKQVVLWPEDGSFGVYQDTVELETEEYKRYIIDQINDELSSDETQASI